LKLKFTFLPTIGHMQTPDRPTSVLPSTKITSDQEDRNNEEEFRKPSNSKLAFYFTNAISNVL